MSNLYCVQRYRGEINSVHCIQLVKAFIWMLSKGPSRLFQLEARICAPPCGTHGENLFPCTADARDKIKPTIGKTLIDLVICIVFVPKWL